MNENTKDTIVNSIWWVTLILIFLLAGIVVVLATGPEKTRTTCEIVVNSDGTWEPRGWTVANRGFPPVNCNLDPEVEV